jgi:electron transfer flavoprotein alpha subunit
MAAGCLEVEVDGAYELTRQRWGGSLVEHARLEAPTKLLTAAAHEHPIREADETTEPEVRAFEPDLPESAHAVRLERTEESDVEGVPLGEARVVVGGGRGVGGPDGYDQLEELADLLGGAVGASRAAVNEGWRSHDSQIGLTGTKISPDIYIACGISGAVQHMVGCKGASNVLAINTDPEAAIMQKAEYAVVGDLHEVVPALNEAVRAEK